MGAIGIILKNSLGLAKLLKPPVGDPFKHQEKVLLKLLETAADTQFGREYGFKAILKSKNPVKAFQQQVPVHTYESMFSWWKHCLEGEHSVTWPGKVEHFALSSGTSEGSSKYIPVTGSMLKAIQRASVNQMVALAHCDLPQKFFQKRDILMLGGSTSLDYNGVYQAGDLSGITTGNLPFWFRPFYKPGEAISASKDWQKKLELITEQAKDWDVVAVVGVPTWIQLLFEKVIERHGLNNIHDIWPNLMVFVHGGVAFEPYKKSFSALLGKPLKYLETYLASEGFIAYQSRPDAEGMRMIIRNKIFYEFIPFNEKNFDSDGSVKPNAQVLTFDDIEEGKDYALLMSTCAGAWRYLIGDVIRFTDLKKWELRITGRTKHFLSLTGEHLSVENMNKAIETIAQEMNLNIKEYTVAGIPHDKLFAHHWFIGTTQQVDTQELRQRIDEALNALNDDYRVVRKYGLKEIFMDVVEPAAFHEWLKKHGKEGAQIKFPRVLKKEQYTDWMDFIAERKSSQSK